MADWDNCFMSLLVSLGCCVRYQSVSFNLTMHHISQVESVCVFCLRAGVPGTELMKRKSRLGAT